MSAVLVPAEEWRASLLAGRRALREAYLRNPSPAQLLRGHTRLIDRILRGLWRDIQPAARAALVATGGYGRGELFPCSDIDILVLLARDPSPAERERLERLVGMFWDIGLEVGHSVRTVRGCGESAAQDITIQTALLEARHLAGSHALVEKLVAATAQGVDAPAFLKAKTLEQEQRHAKHQDAAYALEPNLKEAPGGLRDLQTIQWIARACGFG